MAEENKKNVVPTFEMYRLLAENSPDVLLQTNKFGKILFMSKNVESEYGYKLNDIIGRHFRNFVPGTELPKLLFKMREMIAGKTIIGFRSYAKHKDGNLIPIELSGKFITYKNKSFFNAIMRNISEKIDSEKALRESELQRKFILDTIPDLLFIISSKGIITSYHGNIKNLYQPPELFLNKLVKDVLPKDLSVKTLKYLKIALKTKKIQIFQYSLKIKNRIKWYEARMLAINSNEVISIVRDITSLKEQQDEILKNNEYLQSLFNSASEIIFTIDCNMKIIIWNKSATILTGYTSREIINNNYNKYKFISNIYEFEDYLSELFNKGKIKTFEIIIDTKFKTKKILNVSPSFIYNESNKLTEILFICKDITFEKNTSNSIDFGKSYFFLEKNINKIITIFNNKLKNNNKGIIITRDIFNKIEIPNKSNVQLINISSQNNNINDLKSFYTFLDNNIKLNNIIIIDRLDYFINKYSFKQVLFTLYKINDIIRLRNALLLIRFNPYLYSDEEIEKLREEFIDFSYEKTEEITIDKELLDIIEYIYSRNQNNVIVSYKDIGLKFNLSKITVAKKINKLKDLNLVKSVKSGRMKILKISDFGKNIIKKI